MFAKLISAANLCTALTLCAAMFGPASAAPVQLDNALYGRDLQPITPTSQIQPGMFDLLDQFRNLAQQAVAAPRGTPQYTALVSQLNSTKAQLEAAIQGVAVLATDPPPTSTNTTTPSVATTTALPGSKSESTGASSSLTTSPTETVSTNVPAVTIVTQV